MYNSTSSTFIYHLWDQWQTPLTCVPKKEAVKNWKGCTKKAWFFCKLSELVELRVTWWCCCFCWFGCSIDPDSQIYKPENSYLWISISDVQRIARNANILLSNGKEHTSNLLIRHIFLSNLIIEPNLYPVDLIGKIIEKEKYHATW